MSGSTAKAKRREEAAKVTAMATEFSQVVAAMRMVAMDPRNLILTQFGEEISTKLGFIPETEERTPLKGLLSYAFKFPSWSTHVVVSFSREEIVNPKRGVVTIQHLSMTWHVPIVATQGDVGMLKDEFLEHAMPRVVLERFFPEGGDLVSSVRALTPVSGKGDIAWTPVVFHFYLEEAA